MSIQVQIRRGAAANVAAATPAQGEVWFDTTNNRLVGGDGMTAGGFAAAKLSEAVLNTASLNVLALGAHGSSITIQVAEQLVSALSGSSVIAGVQIPPGALVMACGARVTTAITGATSFSVGYTGSATAFGSGLGISLGSSNAGMIGPNPFYNATNLILTSAGGSFSGGAVRLALMYLSFSPPSS